MKVNSNKHYFLQLLCFFFFSITSGFSQSFESSNLPIVILNTGGAEIPDEPKIFAEMRIIFNGEGETNNLSDTIYDFDSKIGIEKRGSSSQYFYDKKSYGIELKDEFGQDTSRAILGLPKEEDWILYAPFGDKSLIRNYITFYMGDLLGHYASRTKLCEVVLNGEYQGVYVLMEKVKRDNDRVDIAKLTEKDIEGDDLTGGYIIKIDKSTGGGGDGFVSNYPPPYRDADQTIFYQYEYPKEDDITDEQKNYIQNYISGFEDVMKSSDFSDPVNGYRRYIDTESFIDYFIINEVTRNVDGYRLSSFLHKDKDSKDGRLKAGPIWDYNLSFGNADYCDGWKEDGFAADFNTICPGDYWQVPFWWFRLRSDETFISELNSRWTKLRTDKLKTENLMAFIDSVANVLEEPKDRNFEKWPILGEYVWPNSFVGNTHKEEVDFLKNWLTNRMDWLDANLSVVLGTEEESLFLENGLTIYPNPIQQNEFEIAYTLLQPGEVSISVIDLLGKNLGDINLSKQASGSFSEKITLNNLDIQPGMYVILFQIDGKSISYKKIIKD